MDKPLMTERADPLIAGERALEKAFADAASVVFGFGRREGARDAPVLDGPSLALSEIRDALVGARWRPGA